MSLFVPEGRSRAVIKVFLSADAAHARPRFVAHRSVSVCSPTTLCLCVDVIFDMSCVQVTCYCYCVQLLLPKQSVQQAGGGGGTDPVVWYV